MGPKCSHRQTKKTATEDELVGWHQQLSGHESEHRIRKPGMLQSTGSQRVRYNLATEQQQIHL